MQLHKLAGRLGAIEADTHELHARIQNELVPDDNLGEDNVLWKHSEDTYNPCFSSSRTWDQITEKRTTVFWSKSVWFTQEVPRFSFIVWLAARNRLSTGNRMRTWNIQHGCVLCGERDETRDHIFFACPYFFTVWDTVARKLTGNRTNPNWMTSLRFVCRNNV